MKQLSGTDVMFLTQEKGNQTAHVGGLAIYDPSTAPGGVVRFKSILDFYTRRLNLSKVFRRRLVRTPLNLDRPYWVDEPDIDVEYHIRHIALPHPGDWRQLCIQVARIHARPLDLSKPAWEAYVIEGLNNIPNIAKGSFAMYTKFHHAAIDGEAGAALMGALHSLSAESDQMPARAAKFIADSEPTAIELLSRMVGNRYAQARIAASLVKDVVPLALSLGQQQVQNWRGKMQAQAMDTGESASAKPGDKRAEKRAPSTRFNAPLSPHRVIEAIQVPLDDCQTIRNAFPGVTINDIFLATSGGAVRSYLLAKKELPPTSLRAMVPMSTRGENKDADAGNQIGMAVMSICSDVADAAERLQKVHQGSSRGKKQVAKIGKDIPAKLNAIAPAFLVDAVLRKFIIPTINLVVSNVRGPSTPLYVAGARLQAMMPINMLFDGQGLSITGFSYNGVLWVCCVADRSMMPDPAFFAQCFKDSFTELLAAAKPSASKPAKTAATKKPAAKRKTT